MDLDKVTIQLDYQLRGNHGMFYVADKLGYFKDEGIDVDSIKTGTGSPDALRIVGTGGADFGFADLPSLVTARSQEVPVTTLAAVNQTSPLAMCTVKDKNKLTSIDDLKGMTVGIHAMRLHLPLLSGAARGQRSRPRGPQGGQRHPAVRELPDPGQGRHRPLLHRR